MVDESSGLAEFFCRQERKDRMRYDQVHCWRDGLTCHRGASCDQCACCPVPQKRRALLQRRFAKIDHRQVNRSVGGNIKDAFRKPRIGTSRNQDTGPGVDKRRKDRQQQAAVGIHAARRVDEAQIGPDRMIRPAVMAMNSRQIVGEPCSVFGSCDRRMRCAQVIHGDLNFCQSCALARPRPWCVSFP